MNKKYFIDGINFRYPTKINKYLIIITITVFFLQRKIIKEKTMDLLIILYFVFFKYN